ncbi:MAG: 3-hydroxyacyl-CoA dehydrogenase NAD-binding domain-containing protein, partial [Planctomycetota bacterium]
MTSPANKELPKKVAVIGAGTMGNGIAQVFASHGVETALIDIEQAFVDRGLAAVGKSLDRFVKKEKISAEDRDAILGRIKGSTSIDAV